MIVAEGSVRPDVAGILLAGGSSRRMGFDKLSLRIDGVPCVQRIARQVLTALAFLHSVGLIHSDLKPENILVKSYSKCEVKVRGGGGCFRDCCVTDIGMHRCSSLTRVFSFVPWPAGD